jgi:hypothetical protein
MTIVTQAMVEVSRESLGTDGVYHALNLTYQRR